MAGSEVIRTVVVLFEDREYIGRQVSRKVAGTRIELVDEDDRIRYGLACGLAIVTDILPPEG